MTFELNISRGTVFRTSDLHRLNHSGRKKGLGSAHSTNNPINVVSILLIGFVCLIYPYYIKHVCHLNLGQTSQHQSVTTFCPRQLLGKKCLLFKLAARNRLRDGQLSAWSRHLQQLTLLWSLFACYLLIYKMMYTLWSP